MFIYTFIYTHMYMPYVSYVYILAKCSALFLSGQFSAQDLAADPA